MCSSLPAMTSYADYKPLTFHDAARRFTDGNDNPRAYLERCLETIAAREPVVKAITAINETGARADASVARWKAGSPLSPIDGMPVAIKDLLETRDMPTEMGCAAMKGNFPKRDNAGVWALRQAGAARRADGQGPEHLRGRHAPAGAVGQQPRGRAFAQGHARHPPCHRVAAPEAGGRRRTRRPDLTTNLPLAPHRRRRHPAVMHRPAKTGPSTASIGSPDPRSLQAGLDGRHSSDRQNETGQHHPRHRNERRHRSRLGGTACPGATDRPLREGPRARQTCPQPAGKLSPHCRAALPSGRPVRGGPGGDGRRRSGGPPSTRSGRSSGERSDSGGGRSSRAARRHHGGPHLDRLPYPPLLRLANFSCIAMSGSPSQIRPRIEGPPGASPEERTVR
ncbi:MAG: hypothetical protein GEV13_22615 [Rhodospirillales bacterium]|nr:hypothetical protein [Rhodospirillales bacterium]